MTLTAQQKTDLNNEITNDPTGKGYAGLLPDKPGHVVDLLNAKTEPKLGLLDRTNLTLWSVGTQMRAVIQDEAANPASELRSSALAILDVLTGGSSTGIDFAKPENMTEINKWEIAGKLSTAHKAAMLSMATHPASRAEVLGLPYMTVDLFLTRNQ